MLGRSRFIPLHRTMLAVLALGAVIVTAGPAHAAPSSNLLDRPTLTGNWGGARTRLASIGIHPFGFYVGDFADAFSGGKRQGNDYAQQFGFGARVDLGKLAGLTGGTFKIGFNLRAGRSVSADYVGNRLGLQEAFGAGETMRLQALDYQQRFAGGALVTKIGFFPLGDNFANTPALCTFEGAGFCAHPQNLPASSGWSDYPTGKWGGLVKIYPEKRLYLEAGVFDVNPGYYAHTNGLKISMSDSTGAIFPVELGLTTAFGAARLPGHYKLGAYYDTSSAPDVTRPADMRTGRYGFYLLADQMLFSFDGHPNRGLVAYLQYSMSDPRTAVFQTTWLAALIAKGPFAARPHDYINIGFVHAGINHKVINAKTASQIAAGNANPMLAEGENVVEAGYGFQATPWLLLHPNIQYVANPGAFSYRHLPNAWVFGFETKVKF